MSSSRTVSGFDSQAPASANPPSGRRGPRGQKLAPAQVSRFEHGLRSESFPSYVMLALLAGGSQQGQLFSSAVVRVDRLKFTPRTLRPHWLMPKLLHFYTKVRAHAWLSVCEPVLHALGRRCGSLGSSVCRYTLVVTSGRARGKLRECSPKALESIQKGLPSTSLNQYCK